METKIDSDDESLVFASMLKEKGIRTQFVCRSLDRSEGGYDNVECQAFVISTWITVTDKNINQILDGTFSLPKIILFHLDDGDIVRAIDGKIGTVGMIYYDYYHTGSSCDLIRLTFEDGTQRTCFSTSKYIEEKLPKSSTPQLAQVNQ